MEDYDMASESFRRLLWEHALGKAKLLREEPALFALVREYFDERKVWSYWYPVDEDGRRAYWHEATAIRTRHPKTGAPGPTIEIISAQLVTEK